MVITKTYDYLNQTYLLKDSLMNADRLRHAALLESVYQTEKELIIAALESVKKISRIIYFSVILISMMLIVLLFLQQKQ